MVNLNNVYNYYGTHIISQNKNNARFNSHKKNDLKSLYNSMVKQNTSSPLYKFNFSDSIQAYALGIKEAAMALEAESQSLSGNNSTSGEMLAVSDDEKILFASLNDRYASDLPEELSIQVKTLASGQVNVGTYLASGDTSFAPGNYSFGISVNRNQFTFNISVNNGDTNSQIQNQLANAINENHIGVHASVRNNRVNGTSALVIQSDSVGLSNRNKGLIFQFDETYLENDIASALGIEHVESTPSNAEFYINDTLHTSVSNRISLNHSIDVDLLSTSEAPVSIRLVPDEDKISNRLDNFIHSYNQLIDIARSASGQRGATRLLRDITRIGQRNQEALSQAGLTVDTDGYLEQSGETDSAKIYSLFDEELSSFRKEIKRAAGKMTLNPLDYIDKVVVTYPNTNGIYPNPYNPSKYSGLLFNDYA